MSALKSFKLAIDLTTRKRDQASQDLMLVQRAHSFAQDQQSQLEIYAHETSAKWSAAAQTGTTTELMRHHYQFMDRLQHAIGLQGGVIESSLRKLEAARRVVLEAEFRLAGLTQVLKKKQAVIDVFQSRREQKQMDEFASLRSGQAARESASGGQP
jgi:flagellar FliJ protein